MSLPLPLKGTAGKIYRVSFHLLGHSPSEEGLLCEPLPESAEEPVRGTYFISTASAVVAATAKPSEDHRSGCHLECHLPVP